MPTPIVVVSYSELDTFRQCPLKHQWSYVERWQRPTEPGGALSRGTLWHKVMEAHYRELMVLQGRGKLPKRPNSVTMAKKWEQECRRAVAPLLCNPITGEQTGDQELIAWMYEGYLEQWGLDTGDSDFPDGNNWRILAVEVADVMPMPLPNGNPSTRYHLKTKIDLVVQDLSDQSIHVVDHKSGGTLPWDKDLDLDDQFPLYVLMLRLNRKLPVAGTIYNAARTQRNKGPMKLVDRFGRYPRVHPDEELRSVARDCLAAAVTSRRKPPAGLGVYSAPNPQQCSWKCDFRDTHLLVRRGVPHTATLPSAGFVQDFRRH